MVNFKPHGLVARATAMIIPLNRELPDYRPAARVLGGWMRNSRHHAVPKYAPPARLGCDLARWKTPAASVSAAATSSRASIVAAFLGKARVPLIVVFRSIATDRLAASNGRDSTSADSGPSTTSWRKARMSNAASDQLADAGNNHCAVRYSRAVHQAGTCRRRSIPVRSPLFHDQHPKSAAGGRHSK